MKRFGVLLFLLALAWTAETSADSGPVVPCGPDAAAPDPAFGVPARARIWRAGDIDSVWAPPACLGWTSRRFTVMTALAGSFGLDGTVDDLLAKFGAQSAWRGMEYWSVTGGRWETLITDATAVVGYDRQHRRPDFSAAELKSGTSHYFLQKDNRSSDMVLYRMRVTEVDDDRLVVTIENASAVSLLAFTLFDVGDLQSTYIFVRRTPTTWGYYNLSRFWEGPAVIGNHEASYLNRATAFYRYLVGIPGNREPVAVQ